jgi:hypothetical protein
MFLEWEMFLLKVVEEIKTQFICNNFLLLFYFFIWNIFQLWDNVVKYCRAWQATGDIMAHAHCVLDT